MKIKTIKKRYLLWLCLVMMLLFILAFPIGYIKTRAGSKTRINKSEISLFVGETYKLNVKGTNDTVEWNSSDKNIASVSSKGKVKAKKGGKVIISALVNDVAYSCEVTVKCRQHNYKIDKIIKKAKKEKTGVAVCTCRDCGEIDENHEIFYQPTEEKAYKDIIAMKKKYPEGKAWSNDDYYYWEIDECFGFGCAGFAFLISDAVFGTKTPVIEHNNLANLKVGDIIRIDHNHHSVIVLDVAGDTITVCEGNYDKKVHWGRTLSKKKLETDEDLYINTRYLDY